MGIFIVSVECFVLKSVVVGDILGCLFVSESVLRFVGGCYAGWVVVDRCGYILLSRFVMNGLLV